MVIEIASSGATCEKFQVHLTLNKSMKSIQSGFKVSSSDGRENNKW